MTVALFLLNISLQGSRAGEWGEKVISVGDSWSERSSISIISGRQGGAMNPDGHRRIDLQVESLMKGLADSFQ
jgi:hypothetical protein